MFQYSFANVDLILEVDFNGRPASNPKSFKVQGYVAGENLITLNRRAPIATTQFGAYGRMVASMQRIKAGDLVFPVLMNSLENKYLQDWANHFQEIADSDDGELVIPIQGILKDNMGKDEAIMSNGVILAMPAMVRGQTMNTVTWVITFETLTFERKHGGDIENAGN